MRLASVRFSMDLLSQLGSKKVKTFLEYGLEVGGQLFWEIADNLSDEFATAFGTCVVIGTGMGLYAQHELAPFLSSETEWIPLASGVALGAVFGGMSGALTWLLKDPSPFKKKNYPKKAEEAFRPSHCTHTIFVTDKVEDKNLIILWDRLGNLLEMIPPQDNVIVLGHEQLFLSLKESKFFASAMNDLRNSRPYVTMLLGVCLFSTNGAHRWLAKGENRKSLETYPIAFRICAELHQFDLSDTSALYFVSAAAIETDSDHHSVIKRPARQTIYINDVVMGLRRITPDLDSGWLASSEIAIWDDPTHRHYAVSLG